MNSLNTDISKNYILTLKILAVKKTFVVFEHFLKNIQ